MARLDVRRQTVEVLLEQFVLHIRSRPVDIAGRCPDLVRSQYEAATFLAQVPGSVRLPQHAHFRQAVGLALADRRMGFGDDVLMLDRNDRHLEPHHGADLAREAPRCADHVLAGDGALGRHDEPLSRRRTLDTGDTAVAVDLCAAVARTGRQRLSEVGRLDVAVFRMLNCADETFGIAQRPDLADFLRRQEPHVHTDGLGDPCILVVLVHAVPFMARRMLETLAESHIHSGLLLKLLIEAHRVLVHLADRIAHVEEREQACGMPGRPGCEFLAFHKDHIAPALSGEVVERTDTDDTAADHDHTGVGFHHAAPRYRSTGIFMRGGSSPHINSLRPCPWRPAPRAPRASSRGDRGPCPSARGRPS